MSATALLLVTACIQPDQGRPTLAGSELFKACASCHGDTGQGNATIAAPPIAGLPAWYVEAQLTKFRSGLRGYHPDDSEGLRMRPMSRQMMNEAEVKSVAAYVSTLTYVKAVASLESADAAAGAGSYATCLACHGDHAQGNEAMKAPPLAGQADWYLVSQLKKFKGGLRGAKADDVTGGQMRGMAATLADEQAIKNVVAHIGTFNR